LWSPQDKGEFDKAEHSKDLTKAAMGRSAAIVRSQKPLLGQDLVEEVEAASPCLLLLRRHFLLLLQGGAARQAV